MDTRRAYKNIVFSGVFRVVVLLLTIPVRSLMIRNLGNEVTGLYSLFNSLINVLSIAESGIGVSIIYSMYKHIKNNKRDEIVGLYKLFRKIYYFIACLVLLFGIILGILLPLFNNTDIDSFNVYIPYFIMVISSSLSYMFAAKISVMNAHKDNYKTTIITSLGYTLQYVLQIVNLLFIKSFIIYTLMIFIGILAQWLLTNIIFNKQYHIGLEETSYVSETTKNELKINIRSMLIHKIGNILFTSSPSLVISYFLGITLLGVYTNYNTILLAVSSIFTVMFTSITSVVGHAYLSNNRKMFLNYFKVIRVLNIAIGIILFLGFIAIQNVFIPIIFDSGIVFSKVEIVALTVSQFAIFIRQTNIVFKESSGLFYADRKRPILEVVVNVLLAIVFVKWFGLWGVFAASILTTILLSNVMETVVLYKKVFKTTPSKKMIEDLVVVAVFSALSFLISYHDNIFESISHHVIINFLLNGLSSVLISIITIFILFYHKSNKDIFRTVILDYKKTKGESQ